MGRYIVRRLLTAIPTLLVISFVIFAVLELSPSDPTGNLPMTIPQEVREKIREAMGANDPFHIKYLKWMRQFFISEPLNMIEDQYDVVLIQDPESPMQTRLLSYATRSPVFDLILERLPQTMWVVGLSFILSIVIALPVGIISAYKQYSIFDQLGTLLSMIGFSIPTFFTGVVAIVVFSVPNQWWQPSWWPQLPSIYSTTHDVTDWESFVYQIKQSIMPVTVLALYSTAQLAQFTRSAVLENLNQDYVRTARAKGLRERVVLLVHILRNSLIPVITLIALGIPGIFGGAIITEQIFRVNGLGQLLIIAIQGADLPLVQTLTFIFAILIVAFNILADVAYGILDPRIRYD